MNKITMQDFDQTFSKNFRVVIPKTKPSNGRGYPLPYQSMLSDPQYFQCFTTTGLDYIIGVVTRLLNFIPTIRQMVGNASATDTTWPSYGLLHNHLPFPTNHNLGFIHTHSQEVK